FGLGQLGHGGDLLIFVEGDQADPLSIAPDHGNILNRHADDLAPIADHHDVVGLGHLVEADPGAGLVGHLHGDDPHAAPSLNAVLVGGRALAVAVFADGQDRGAGIDDLHAHHPIALLEAHAAHARSGAPHGAGFILVEADGEAVPGSNENILRAVGDPRLDKLVTLIDAHGDDAPRAGVGIGHELGFLDRALARRLDDVTALNALLHRHDGGHLLVGGHVHHIHDGLSLGGATGLGNVIDLQPINAALGGKNQDVTVGGSHEEILDEVFFTGGHGPLAQM